MNKTFGGPGSDFLSGGSRHDVIHGGKGANHLDGKEGMDTLYGGLGKDTFEFRDALFRVDAIKDFTPGHDHIALDPSIFQGMPEGSLQAAQFHIGPHATTADQRIIYQWSTGALFYDSDGVGGTNQVKFAQLSPHLSLHAGDLFVSDFI